MAVFLPCWNNPGTSALIRIANGDFQIISPAIDMIELMYVHCFL